MRPVRRRNAAEKKMGKYVYYRCTGFKGNAARTFLTNAAPICRAT